MGKQLNIQVSDELAAALDGEADRSHIPKARIVRLALGAYLGSEGEPRRASTSKQADVAPGAEPVLDGRAPSRPEAAKPRLPDRSEVQSPSLERFMPEGEK